MFIRNTFKSHFKIKKTQYDKKKHIFTKNITIFLLFSKVFFKICLVNIKFEKRKKNKTSFLKAPSRHKKYFHQTLFEYFTLKFFFFFNSLCNISYKKFIKIYKNFYKFFIRIGSNTLTHYSFHIECKLNVNIFQNFYKLF